MATYALYYHPSTTMVHNRASGYPTTAPPYSPFQLHTSKPSLPPAPRQEQNLGSSLPNAQRESLPASRKVTPGVTDAQEDSLFFKLPAELRNQIYVDLLCPDAGNLKGLTKRVNDLNVRHYNQTSTVTSLHPAILSTCRRVHDEATSLLYAPHIFHAHPSLLTSLPHLTSAAKPVLYPSVINLISRWQICLRLDTDPQFTAAQATAAFSGAEYLEIRVWQAQFEACDYAVLKLFDGVRGVQFARVGGDVDARLARWLEEQMMLPKEEECGEDEVCLWKGVGEVLCGRCYEKASSTGTGVLRLKELS